MNAEYVHVPIQLGRGFDRIEPVTVTLDQGHHHAINDFDSLTPPSFGPTGFPSATADPGLTAAALAAAEAAAHHEHVLDVPFVAKGQEELVQIR